MMVVPTANADINPVGDTVALLVLSDDQVKAAPEMVLPRESRATAWISCVFPGFRVTDDGDTLIEAIVTDAGIATAGTDVVRPPAEAVMSALPAPTRVTLPAVSTLATCVFEDAHVNVMPEIATPL